MTTVKEFKRPRIPFPFRALNAAGRGVDILHRADEARQRIAPTSVFDISDPRLAIHSPTGPMSYNLWPAPDRPVDHEPGP